MVTTSDRLQIPPIRHFYNLILSQLPQRIRQHPLAATTP
jgi:hypothetical protein